jgi:hypothetical protein
VARQALAFDDGEASAPTEGELLIPYTRCLVARSSALLQLKAAISWAVSWAQKLGSGRKNIIFYLNQKVKWWAL